MNTQGIDPIGYFNQVSRKLNELNTREEIEPVLDELEYLFEVIDPEFQDGPCRIIEILRDRLARL
jgi:CRISPR/Cas system-associated protein Cas10 (large subunit of type III CRISPR-Cas system)